MKKILFILLLSTIQSVEAQQTAIPENDQQTDLTFGFGNKQGSISGAYYYNWNFGKSNKFFIGLGARFTDSYSMTDANIYFKSAKPSLAKDETKTDSLLIISPNSYSLNIALNMGYHISPRFRIGLNIDLAGFSLGKRYNGLYISEGLVNNTSAKPTSFNALLIGNNDRGTLNSEFYLQYNIKKKYGVKVAFQHLFWEYTTTTKVQTRPEDNDRFRKISNLLNVGFTRRF